MVVQVKCAVLILMVCGSDTHPDRCFLFVSLHPRIDAIRFFFHGARLCSFAATNDEQRVAECRHPPQADGYQQCKTLRVLSFAEALILINAIRQHSMIVCFVRKTNLSPPTLLIGITPLGSLFPANRVLRMPFEARRIALSVVASTR